MTIPLPLVHMPVEARRRVRLLFTDIDDTLTTDGLLGDAAYAALWRLRKSGLHVVPVTGRPAGWCDHIARMWPVRAVIGENGAFYFSYDHAARKMSRHYLADHAEREKSRSALAAIEAEVLREVPGSAVSADQAYRIADLAIDFREDVDPLDRAAVARICAIAARHGAVCKVSSIHVNIWYGGHDKMACLREYLLREAGARLEDLAEEVVFVGDSPNDEPLFREVRQSIGVANIADFLADIRYPPRYITSAASGGGFVEAVDFILEAQ